MIDDAVVNFNLVEGSYRSSSIYDDFATDYLKTNVPNKDLRVKYDLSHKEFWDLAREVREDYGLKKRPVHYIPRYYYRVKRGYIIQKRYGLEMVYLGFVQTEDMAKKMVELCKNASWHIDECRRIIRTRGVYAK